MTSHVSLGLVHLHLLSPVMGARYSGFNAVISDPPLANSYLTHHRQSRT